MATCLELVRREITDLSEKDLDEVLEQMRARQARIINDGGDPSTAAAQAGVEVADMLRAAAAIERRNAAINFKVRTEALDYIRQTWADDPVEGVLALLYGSPKARFGSRASVNAAQSANFRKYEAGVWGDLQQAGLFDVLRRGEMDRDVTRAMWSIDDPQALRQIPAQAVEIAKVLQKWQEVARLDANRHGGWVGKLDNYVVRQSHSADRIGAAGEAAWKADITARLDMARTFPDGPPRDLDAWLHETYANLTTGIRPKSGDATAERMAAFKGPGNLARKMSQERVLHFKSADDWFDYNTQFGYGNLRESYIGGLHKSAESTGLMQVLGTNPEYNLDAIVTAIKAQLSRENPELLTEFNNRTRGGKRIANALAEVSGQTRQVGSSALATVGSTIRTWNMLTGLGGAVISAVTDVPVRASALRYQGQSYLGEIARGVMAPLQRIVGATGGGAERNAVLAGVGYFNEIAVGNLATRFSPDDNIPGKLSKAANTFFKWNLLSGWTDTMRRSSLESMGRFFGGLSETPFRDISDRTRRTLERFRIDEPTWEAMRAGIVEESGERFLSPTAIRELDPETFRGLAADRIRVAKEAAAKSGKVEQLDRQVRTILEDAREQTADRLQQLYADEVNSAVISPDARTLAFVRQGQSAGTPMGEALRLFWQFKSFGIAIMQRGFMREFYGYGKGAGGKAGMSEIGGLALLMAGSMGFGYVAMSAKDMIKGKTPRPLGDHKTWMAALAQGGGAGIYGDFLFGETNRLGGGFLQTLGGPTIGKADDVAKLFGSLKTSLDPDSRKTSQDVGAEAFGLALRNTPYANLFYTRMVADYWFLYETQEALNPGYLRRMERRAEQEKGQQWWLRPSEVVQ